MHATDPSPHSGYPPQNVIGRASSAAVALLVANSGVLLIYLAYDLTLYQLVLIYWWECLWIGVFSALKLIVASFIGDPYGNRYVSMSIGSRFLASVILIALSGVLFFSILGGVGIGILIAGEELATTNPADELYKQVELIVGSSLLFMISHGWSFVINFLFFREYRNAQAGQLMWMPFKRCLALYAVIALALMAVFLVPGYATTTGFAVIVIVVKVAWDFLLYLGERKSFSPPEVFAQ